MIALLNEENDLFDRLNRTNYAEISKELKELKERICFVILDIKDEITKDFEDKNYEIYKGVADSDEERLEKIKNELLFNSYFESRLGEHSANLKANFIKECATNFSSTQILSSQSSACFATFYILALRPDIFRV